MNISNYKEYGWKDARVLPYHRHLIKNIENFLPADGSPILDVGCGNGVLANQLITKGYVVYGIDASAQGIAITNRITSNYFFVNDVIERTLPMELQKNPFQTVISTEVIEHLYNPRLYVDF